MKKNLKGSCVVCQDVITNPICPECKAEEAVSWLMDDNHNMTRSIRMLGRSFSGGYRNHDDNSIECIKCRKKMNLCTYCFIELLDLEEEKKSLLREYQEIN